MDPFLTIFIAVWVIAAIAGLARLVNYLPKRYGEMPAVWAEVARELGGSYTSKLMVGPQVVVRSGGWTLVLGYRPAGEDQPAQTSITAAIRPLGDVAFTVRPRRSDFAEGARALMQMNLFSIGGRTATGIRQVTLDDPRFDGDFVTHVNRDEVAEHVVGSPALRRLLYGRIDFTRLYVRQDRAAPGRPAQMLLVLPGLETDAETLRWAFGVVSVALEAMRCAGLARPPVFASRPPFRLPF